MAVDSVGVPGQGTSPNPPSYFDVHYVFGFTDPNHVVLDPAVDENGIDRFYDPSYGEGPYDDVRAFEILQIAGTIDFAIAPNQRFRIVFHNASVNNQDPNERSDQITKVVRSSPNWPGSITYTPDPF